MGSGILNLILSPYGIAMMIALVVMLASIIYTVNGLRSFSMDRRIAKIARNNGLSVEEAPELSLSQNSDRIEGMITRFLPSIKGTQAKLRRAGNLMSIRVYILIVLLIGVALSMVVKIHGVPREGMPLLCVLGVYYAGEKFILPMLAARRRRKIMTQLPEMVDYIVRGIVVGQSLDAALRAVVNTIGGPLGQEMAALPKLLDIGAPIEHALQVVGQEMDVPDFDFFVNACLAQLQSGGNLADVLRSLSNTIRSRLQLYMEISAMTAEGRMSVVFLACLPLGLMVYLITTNPGYMDPLFTTDTGQMLFYSIFGLIAVGTYVAWKIAQVKD